MTVLISFWLLRTDNAIVHRIGNAHHVSEVRIEVPAHLIDYLFILLDGIGSDRIDGTGIESYRHKHDA